MVPSYLLGSLHMNRSPSLQSFSSYKRSEVHNLLNGSVSVDGKLLEYETLELRVHPSSVDIDQEADKHATVITVDSANRPGTLVEVVQVLTELGLHIVKARISSDRGWFVDVFHVTEPCGSKVTDERKLDTIRKMMNIDFDTGEELDDAYRNEASMTLFELAGQDRQHLLADVTHLLTTQGCDVWTYRQRSALVLAATKNGRPLQVTQELAELRRQLMKMMDPSGKTSYVNIQHGRGFVHHERRLHKLLLMEEQRFFSRGGGSSGSGGGGGSSSALPSILERPRMQDEDSDDTAPSPSGGSEKGAGGLPLYRSPKHSRPEICISLEPTSYWLVTIECKDRDKLLFDTVCTMADLDYDIHHASIDSEAGLALQEYHVKPRLLTGFDEEQAARLKHMLELSIQCRFPEGVKLHVQTADSCGQLAVLSEALSRNHLTITRAKVRTLAAAAGAGAHSHTFYLMDVSGRPPSAEQVRSACSIISSSVAGSSIEEASALQEAGGHTEDSAMEPYSFSVLQHQWHRGWAGSPSSSTSSS